jgi:flagellum-specific peptidoglycan hydrolase FlgJ
MACSSVLRAVLRVGAPFACLALASAGCRSRALDAELARAAGSVVASSAAGALSVPSTRAPERAAPSTLDATGFDASRAARDVCDHAIGAPERVAALAGFARYQLGTRPFSLAAARVDREACVAALLPSAIAIELRAGIPAGVTLGMAIQETGGCGGKLVESNNFHGQKANLAASGFSHWRGDSIEIASSESRDAGGPKIKSAFMRFDHVDFSFEALAERLVHPDVRGHRYEPCLSLRDRAPAFARCVGRIWSVHEDYAERVLRHRATWKLDRCELAPTERRVEPRFSLRR